MHGNACMGAKLGLSEQSLSHGFKTFFYRPRARCKSCLACLSCCQGFLLCNIFGIFNFIQLPRCGLNTVRTYFFASKKQTVLQPCMLVLLPGIPCIKFLLLSTHILQLAQGYHRLPFYVIQKLGIAFILGQLQWLISVTQKKTSFMVHAASFFPYFLST